MDLYLSLVEDLVERGVLRTPRIIEAFKKIHRRDFLPPLLKECAGDDAPLPIGKGQTISQPYTVAFMLELLGADEGQKIMDIGYGSGWTTALLAYITGVKGNVYSVEIIPELCAFGEENVGKYNFIEKGVVKMFCKDGSMGLANHAPFDRILVSASGRTVPRSLLSQLAQEGRLAAPIKESIFLYEKRGKQYESKEYPGFLFVPLIHK